VLVAAITVAATAVLLKGLTVAVKDNQIEQSQRTRCPIASGKQLASIFRPKPHSARSVAP
jgi:hypothetical protein